MKLHFKDDLYDAQLLRAVGHATYRGAEIGECPATVDRVKELDADGWYDAWMKTADRIRAIADESLAAARTVSARREGRRPKASSRDPRRWIRQHHGGVVLLQRGEPERIQARPPAQDLEVGARLSQQGVGDAPRAAGPRRSDRRGLFRAHAVLHARGLHRTHCLPHPRLRRRGRRRRRVRQDHVRPARRPKTYLRFLGSDGAGAHCERGGRALFHEKVFAWLAGLGGALAGAAAPISAA